MGRLRRDPPAGGPVRRRARRHGRRLGSALARIEPPVLRGRGREQRLRRLGGQGPGVGRALLAALAAARRGGRGLDDPDRHLPRERRHPRVARARRFPDRRPSRTDWRARRRLARHAVPRAATARAATIPPPDSTHISRLIYRQIHMANAVTPVILGLLSLGPRSGLRDQGDRRPLDPLLLGGELRPDLPGAPPARARRADRRRGRAERRPARRVYRLTTAGPRRAPDVADGQGDSRSSSATSRCCGSSSPTRCRTSRRSGCSRDAGAASSSTSRRCARSTRDPARIRRSSISSSAGASTTTNGGRWCAEQLERLAQRETAS